MRAVVQRVNSARVIVDGKVIGQIGKGFVVLLGVGLDDNETDIDYLSDKILNLRVFEDQNDKMNLSLLDVNGELLIVSQFTLYGDLRKGKRPNFMKAAPPDMAKDLYDKFVKKCTSYGIKVDTGEFKSHMEVELINDGPVTILIDSKKSF